MLLNLSKSIVLEATTQFTLGTFFMRDIISLENGHSANFPQFGSQKIQGCSLLFNLCTSSMDIKLIYLLPSGFKDTLRWRFSRRISQAELENFLFSFIYQSQIQNTQGRTMFCNCWIILNIKALMACTFVSCFRLCRQIVKQWLFGKSHATQATSARFQIKYCKVWTLYTA